MSILEVLFAVLMFLWFLFTIAGLAPRYFDLDPAKHGAFAFVACLLIGLRVFFGY
jgi:hypothetical protein